MVTQGRTNVTLRFGPPIKSRPASHILLKVAIVYHLQSENFKRLFLDNLMQRAQFKLNYLTNES
jgi:hypothetical protein